MKHLQCNCSCSTRAPYAICTSHLTLFKARLCIIGYVIIKHHHHVTFSDLKLCSAVVPHNNCYITRTYITEITGSPGCNLHDKNSTVVCISANYTARGFVKYQLLTHTVDGQQPSTEHTHTLTQTVYTSTCCWPCAYTYEQHVAATLRSHLPSCMINTTASLSPTGCLHLHSCSMWQSSQPRSA